MARTRRSGAQAKDKDQATGPGERPDAQAPAKPKPKPGATAARKTSSKTAAAGKKPGGAAASKPKAAGSSPAPRSTKPRELTPKDALFVQHYLITLNATEAYAQSHPGVARTTASTEGVRLLGNPWVAAAIAAGAKREANRLELTKERVFLESARLAFFDPRRMFDKDGNPLQVTKLDDDTAACISGLDVLEQFEGSGEDRKFVGYVKKYKIADKNSALDRAAKLLALFKEDNEQKSAPVAEAVRAMFGHLHEGAGRLPIARPQGKA